MSAATETTEAKPARVKFFDVTLREGQQCAPVAMARAEQIRLAEALAEVGVAAVQVGFANADHDLIRSIRTACPKVGVAVNAVGWQPTTPDDLARARDAGADMCSVLMRASDGHLAALGLSREQAKARVALLVRRAVEVKYADIALAPSFSTNADPGFVMQLYETALDAGATTINVSDSLGVARPEDIADRVRRMRSRFPAAQIKVHMHNDYGLALANTIAGVLAGADVVECTVNGLGERAGNCPLEEAAVALERLYDIRTGIDLRRLTGLVRLAEELSGLATSPMKPIVGRFCFMNKLDIHVQAAVKDPSLMEPYDPAIVGQQRSIELGYGSGPVAIREKLRRAGLEATDAEVGALVRFVNDEATRRKTLIPGDELAAQLARLRAGA